MRSRSLAIACMMACSVVPTAALQDKYDRDASAREYVQFLVTQLDQWTKGFTQAYNMALMRPPVDASKLSEAAKAGATDLRASVTLLSSRSAARDILTNAGFRDELNKCMSVVKDMNEALGSQRFPEAVYNDWNDIRATLNNLARIYKLEALAVLEAPGGGGRGGRRGGGGGQQTATAAPPPGGGVVGYIVDQQCAKRGKGMWTNTACVERCIREGDKVVVVTEEGKIYQIANPDKIETNTYGQKVTVLGKVEGDSITVASLQM